MWSENSNPVQNNQEMLKIYSPAAVGYIFNSKPLLGWLNAELIFLTDFFVISQSEKSWSKSRQTEVPVRLSSTVVSTDVVGG